MAVVFYDSSDAEDESVMAELEKIDDESRRFNIDFVKVSDSGEAAAYGLQNLPGLLYFENKIPSVYDDGPLDDEEAVLKWLVDQKMTVRRI